MMFGASTQNVAPSTHKAPTCAVLSVHTRETAECMVQVREVLEDADKFPELEDKLDKELQSGHRGVLKWHQQVNLALSKNPEFEFHGKDKEGRTVWQLDLTLKPPDKSSKKEKRRRAMQRRQDRESVDMTQC